jgi:hypothetical protein
VVHDDLLLVVLVVHLLLVGHCRVTANAVVMDPLPVGIEKGVLPDLGGNREEGMDLAVALDTGDFSETGVHLGFLRDVPGLACAVAGKAVVVALLVFGQPQTAQHRAGNSQRG